MKKILFLLCLGLVVGCTITRTTYEGTIDYPRNIIFDNANFKYIKTISGSSHAIYDGWGFDKKRVSDGLINTAKADMYKNHNFKPNQVITNISKDIIRTYDEKGLVSKYEVKVVISADIYEFSNNGDYYSKTENLNENTIDKSNNDEQIKNSSKSIEFEGFKKGYYNNFNKGDLVVFSFDSVTYYKAEVQSGAYSESTWLEIKIVEKINEKGESETNFESASQFRKIPIRLITHHKKR